LRSDKKIRHLFISFANIATWAALQLSCGSLALGQAVDKVNNQSVLIGSGASGMKVDQEYYTINDSGKKTGIIKINQVKGDRAVAKILKGSVIQGETLALRNPPAPAKVNSEEANANDTSEFHPRPRAKKFVGFILGYSMDKLSFLAADNNNPVQHSETAGLSGSTMKYKFFLDYPMSDDFAFRFLAGYDGFNGNYSAQSTTINNNGASTSTLSVTLLTAEAEVHWNLYKRALNSFWLGLGYGFDYVLGSTTNMYSLALGTSYLNTVYLGTGFNVQVGPNSYIPVFAQYNYFFTGANVTQSSINVGLGWGWGF